MRVSRSRPVRSKTGGKQRNSLTIWSSLTLRSTRQSRQSKASSAGGRCVSYACNSRASRSACRSCLGDVN
jgi:hypothetical protein